MQTIEQTEEAVKEIRSNRPVHFLQKEMSTSAYVHTLAANRKAVLNQRDPQGLSSDERALLEASNTVIEVPKTWNARPNGPEKNSLARKFNKALKHLQSLAYKEASIIVTTCGNAANEQLAKHFKPTVCYVDEAA